MAGFTDADFAKSHANKRRSTCGCGRLVATGRLRRWKSERSRWRA